MLLLTEQCSLSESKKKIYFYQVASDEVEDLFMLKMVRAILVEPCLAGFSPHSYYCCLLYASNSLLPD